MILVRKVFNVGDRLMKFIKSVILIINSKVVVVKIFCKWVLVMKWKIGCIRCWLVMIIMVIIVRMIMVCN